MNVSVTSMIRIIKMISCCFPIRWESDNTSQLSKRKKKRFDRVNIFLKHLKADTAEQKKTFFLVKNSLQLKLLITIIMTENTQSIQKSSMNPWGQSTANKSRFHPKGGMQSPKLEIHLSFSWNRRLKSTQTSLLLVLFFQDFEEIKNHLKDQSFTFQQDRVPSNLVQ